MRCSKYKFVGGEGQQQLHNFAKIYLNKTPWAHLDIAGMAY